MKIRNFKIWVIGPTLLLIPMSCMHFTDGHDGHHNGSHHSSFLQQLQHLSTHDPMGGRMTEEGMDNG